jgi:hypothetical protein
VYSHGDMPDGPCPGNGTLKVPERTGCRPVRMADRVGDLFPIARASCTNESIRNDRREAVTQPAIVRLPAQGSGRSRAEIPAEGELTSRNGDIDRRA